MTDQFHRLLMRVQKPARYVGGEYNQIIKDKKDVDVRVAFCFPDTYEIGMSNIGMRILYGVMNEMSGVWCERVLRRGAIWRTRCARMVFHSGRWKATTRSGILIWSRSRSAMRCAIQMS